MVTFRNLSRFYSRNSSGKYQLDVGEIRAGFLLAEEAQDRVRRIRADRVARILAGESPVPMGSGPKIILHALPLLPDEIWQRFMGMPKEDAISPLMPIAANAADWRFNLDGFVVHTVRDEPSRNSYTLMFRDGGIEAANGGLIGFDDRSGGGFFGKAIEIRLIDWFTRIQGFWKRLGVGAPVLLALTVSGIQGRKILASAYEDFPEEIKAFDRDLVMIPDVLAYDLSKPTDVILKPLFDLLWNAGGWPCSPNFKNGRFTRQ